MREIKFRAWDKDKKILSPVWQISFRQWELEPDINSITLENDGTYEPINYIIEQYTGLKDKNGVEIYEGDILNRIGINMVVRWNRINIGFDLAVCDDMDNLDRNWIFFSKAVNTDYEVIGNIHQDSHLLNEN